MKAKNVTKSMSPDEVKEQLFINLNEPLGELGSTIRSTIKEMRSMSMSNSEMARRLNVSDGYLSDIVKGKRPISHITVGTVEKMFPNATFSGNISVNELNLNSRNTYNIGRAGNLAERRRIVDLIEHIKDVPAEAKIKIIRAIYEMGE